MLFYCFKERNIQRTIISFKELQFLNIFVQYFPAGLQVAETQVSQKRPPKQNTFLRFSVILFKMNLESKVEPKKVNLHPRLIYVNFWLNLLFQLPFVQSLRKTLKCLML